MRHRVLAFLLPFGIFIQVFGCRHADGPLPTIHTHSAGAGGIFANAYLIETPQGIVAVDAMLTVSDARALRERVDALRKPLLAVLLTHGHPDHYNGVAQLLGSQAVPVIATAGVDRVIRDHDAEKEQQWRPTFGDEWPAVRTFPSRIVEDGETVVLDGVRLTVHALGPGESHQDSYWVIERDDPSESMAFIGDAAFNGVHAYMSDGHVGAWLMNLGRLERDLAGVRTIFPGHGQSGGSDLLAEQKSYLLLYRDTVKRLANGSTTLDDAAKAELVRVMKERLPTDRLEFLIPLGADAVAAELAAE